MGSRILMLLALVLPGLATAWTSGFPSLSLSRYATREAYILDIGLRDLTPDQVQVTVQGGWLLIQGKQSRERCEEKTFEAGRGFVRRYQYRSGTQTRRVTIPGDADVARMRREDSDHRVRILLPRYMP